PLPRGPLPPAQLPPPSSPAFNITLGRSSGGGAPWGSVKQFEDEIHPDLTLYIQFFLILGLTDWLDGKHSNFGCVTTGLGSLNKLEKVETDSHDWPLDVQILWRLHTNITAKKNTFVGSRK
uniref:PPIase cyclophilin-type domain-containing protein n=1 Tax=Xenopus tropicalis TaxID=8364 RepID=A0A6I8RKG9_XENTR